MFFLAPIFLDTNSQKNICTIFNVSSGRSNQNMDKELSESNIYYTKEKERTDNQTGDTPHCALNYA